METEVSEQAISHIKLTFPKRVFEVCHFMKRETEAEFWGTDVAGEFTKQITLSRIDDIHISLSLSVDNLTFEDNNLCFFVDKIKAKDEEEVQKCLETVPMIGTAVNEPTVFNNKIDVDANGDAPKRKRGRPRKADVEKTSVVDDISDVKTLEKSSNLTKPVDGEDSDYLIAPSGRKIRKPARFRELYKKVDEAIKEVDPDIVLSGESDYEDGDPEFKVSIPAGNSADCAEAENSQSGTSSDADSDIDDEDENIETGLDNPDESNQSAPTEGGESSGKLGQQVTVQAPGLSIIQPKKMKSVTQSPTTGSNVKVEKYKNRSKLLKKKKKAQQQKNKTISSGKKRPNYKREANIECRICHHMYKDELSLIAHVQKIHPSDSEVAEYVAELKQQAKVECKLCGKVLGSKRNEMQSHMLRVHGKDDDFISKCDECDMEFRRTFLLKEHKRRQHPKHERILCHLCPASFKLKEYLTEHLKYTHNKTYKWQCDICHKMTSSPKNLRRHKKLHDTALFQCHICNKMFHESGNMRRHILYVHNAQAVPRHACPHCERDFSTKNNLIQHINSVHMKTSAYYCDICKKYFEKKKQLLEHATSVHPGVPILSTQSAEDQLGNLTTDDHSQTVAISGVDSAGGPTTIIIQGPDGTDHILVPQALNQFTNVTELHAATTGSESHLTNEMTQAINAAISGQSIVSGHTVTDASLSIAQQALAAFEAGGLDGTEFGGEQYLSVIGEDGQEIRVQIVRKSTDIHDQKIEGMYVQTVGEDGMLSLEAAEHTQQHDALIPEGHIIVTNQLADGNHLTVTSQSDTIVEGQSIQTYSTELTANAGHEILVNAPSESEVQHIVTETEMETSQ